MIGWSLFINMLFCYCYNEQYGILTIWLSAITCSAIVERTTGTN